MLNLPIQKFQIWLYTFSIVLATAAIILRLIARRHTRTKLQWNDWLMVLAYVHVLALGIAANIAVVHGEMGPHQSQLSPQQAKEVFKLNMKMTIVIPFLLSSSTFLVKMSITHFYIVLFPNLLLTKICKAQLFVLTLCWLGGSIPYFFMCTPIAFTWDRTLKGKCWDIRNFWLAMSVISLFFDLTLVALPIPVVWGLKCDTRKKVKLTALFSLGLFICIITLVRVIKAYTLNFHDLPYSAARAVMCAVPEPVLSIVAGCLPIMAPLFRQAKKKLQPETQMTRPAFHSYESRENLAKMQKSAVPMSNKGRQRRLDGHLYPMGSSVDNSSERWSVVEGPFSGRRDSMARESRSGESYMSGWGSRTSRGTRGTEAPGRGIRVMREVRVDFQRREDLYPTV